MDTRLRFERVEISELVELAIRYIVIDTMAIFPFLSLVFHSLAKQWDVFIRL
jgi:hypothetical protein